MSRTYTVTPSGAGAALTPAEAWLRKDADHFDFNGTFGPLTVPRSRPGITLDMRDAHVKGTAFSTHGLLVLADDVTVLGGEYSGVGKGSGLTTSNTSGVTFDGAHSHHNAKHGAYGGAVDFFTVKNGEFAFNGATGGWGISYRPRSHGDTSPGYHIEITGNDVHDNRQTNVARSTEGGGIIGDKAMPGDDEFKFSVLVSHNKVYDNGNAGFLGIDGKFFVRFNRFEGNMTDTSITDAHSGEIKGRDADIHAVGNTALPDRGYSVLLSGFEHGHKYTWKANFLDGPAISYQAPHDLPGVQAAPLHWDGL